MFSEKLSSISDKLILSINDKLLIGIDESLVNSRVMIV